MAILFVVSIGILGGNIFNVIFLKTYDKGVEQVKSRNATLVPLITGAMFLGMYLKMLPPRMPMDTTKRMATKTSRGMFSTARDSMPKAWAAMLATIVS